MNLEEISFLRLRKYIGILAISIPFQIFIVSGILSSISYSYYTKSHDLFVGNLFAIGLFLFCDKGYDIKDTIFNRISGICAILIALNPCESQKEILFISQSKIHYFCACILFLSLSYILFFLFTKS